MATCTARCRANAPTSSPPKRNEAGIVQSGCNAPNSAATMPLNPASCVKPAGPLSTLRRCAVEDSTSTAPAKPDIIPLKVRASTMLRFTLMPAYRAAA